MGKIDLEEDALGILQKVGAWHENGHFVLASGSHSSNYVDKRALLKDPQQVIKMCLLLRELDLLNKTNIDIVMGPADGATTLAFTLAYLLGQIQERVVLTASPRKVRTYDSEGKFTEAFEFNPANQEMIKGAKILLVEDVITTGRSLGELGKLIKMYGGKIIAVRAIWRRDTLIEGKEIGLPPILSLIKRNLPSWPADECELCQGGIPISEIYGKGKRKAMSVKGNLSPKAPLTLTQNRDRYAAFAQANHITVPTLTWSIRGFLLY